MRLKPCLMMASLTALAAGCADPTQMGGPLFCDVERPRTFSQDESAWRLAHAPENLKLDLATNEAGESHCGWMPAQMRKR